MQGSFPACESKGAPLKSEVSKRGLADRGGWCEEILPTPEIEASFLRPFSYAPLGERAHISGEKVCLLLGVC